MECGLGQWEKHHAVAAPTLVWRCCQTPMAAVSRSTRILAKQTFQDICWDSLLYDAGGSHLLHRSHRDSPIKTRLIWQFVVTRLNAFPVRSKLQLLLRAHKAHRNTFHLTPAHLGPSLEPLISLSHFSCCHGSGPHHPSRHSISSRDWGTRYSKHHPGEWIR